MVYGLWFMVCGSRHVTLPLLQDYVEKIVADTAVLVAVRGAISGSASQSHVTSQVTSIGGSKAPPPGYFTLILCDECI